MQLNTLILAVGLKTAPRGNFSHPKQICDSNHTLCVVGA